MAVKIIGGTYRGMAMTSVKGAKTRPTATRTREALFSILESAAAIQADTRAIDICAGTGALGLECLSRSDVAAGAFCLFIEQSKAACAVISHNIATLALENATQIMRRDAATLSKKPNTIAPFTLALIDPPYGKNIGAAALQGLVKGGWLEAGSMVVLEDDKRTPIPILPAYILRDERIYSDTRLLFYETK
ncbi:MAG: 16S rRNA (guanine(966)-N(2))-methyltransferase RsmD [Alphaproteobacteria bacterium]|nr:16S rRNA (guanine(966)-N(2))-methyltransferase RsmD [Alphaproteobacteria bacterium]